MGKHMVFASVVLVGCTYSPGLLQSPKHEPAGWTTVSLTLEGETWTNQSAEICMEEAHEAGITLAPGAALAGTLVLNDTDKNYLVTASAPRYPIPEANPRTACRLALARLVDLDKLVRIGKDDPPSSCEMIGRADGADSGWLGQGSFAAAVAQAQFKVRAQGGNLFVQDLARGSATTKSASDVRVDGRAFRCAP